MSTWPAIASDKEAGAFSPHMVFQCREHAYCAVLAAALPEGEWRIQEDPHGSGRCVVQLLDGISGEPLGLFCWDSELTVLEWTIIMVERDTTRTQSAREQALDNLRSYKDHVARCPAQYYALVRLV